jgi:hypothetical protein
MTNCWAGYAVERDQCQSGCAPYEAHNGYCLGGTISTVGDEHGEGSCTQWASVPPQGVDRLCFTGCGP